MMLCFIPIWAIAQNVTVKGIVKDASGESVIGASFVEEKTTNGTITDIDGNFTLSVKPDAVLEVSYVGYVTQKIQVKGQTILNILLKEDTQALQEIVVVGYGTQKKEDLTSSICHSKSQRSFESSRWSNGRFTRKYGGCQRIRR